MLRRFFLFAALIILTAGCGSGGSTGATSSTGSASTTSVTSETSATTNIGTGSIAVKVVWNVKGSSSLAKATEKVLYAAPVSVVKMRFTVSGTGMSDITKEFPATPGVNGSGQIDGIPAGTGRKVTVQGLDLGGIVIHKGETLSNITITAGQITNVDPITLNEAIPPITLASPGTAPSVTSVTLTASEPATIYYTTNGTDPDNVSANPSGQSPVENIVISDVTKPIKFFAIDSAGNRETPFKTYTVPISSLTVTW